MPQCFYKNCSNHSAKYKINCAAKSLSFHSIPKEESLREVWLSRMGKENNSIVNGFVCSNHFLEHDVLLIGSKHFLKRGSLPIQYEYQTQMDKNNAFEDKIYSFDMDVESDENDSSMPANEIVVEDDDGWMNVSFDINLNPDPYKEHNYSKFLKSQRKRQLGECNIAMMRSKISKLRRTVHLLRRERRTTIKLCKKKSSKFQNFSELPTFLQEFITIVLKHYNKGSHPKTYSATVRQFALTLQYYSRDAYDYVRDIFLSCLPCDQTIRNWYKSVDGNPGFSSDALLTLQNLQFQTPYRIVGCIANDSMSLRKHLQSNGNTTFGYVDYGGVIPTDKRTMANEALNCMFVGINVPFKLNLVYFLTNGTGARQLANLESIGIELTRDCGVTVATGAFDGLAANLAMAKILGSNGTLLYRSQRNTCITGMLVLIQSLKVLYKEYVLEKNLLKFIPTYKAGQDNLEIFHCQMRSGSGYNTNPTPTQYRSNYRKSLVHVQCRTKLTANCIPLEDIPILHINSTRTAFSPIEEIIVDSDDSELILDGIVQNVLEGQFVNPNYIDETVNVIAYISGFIARRLSNTLRCEACVNALVTVDENDPEFCLILGKQRGGLIFPSRSLREVCSVADKTFRHFLKLSGDKTMNYEFNIKKMTMVVGKYFSDNKTLFDDLEPHFRSHPSDFHYYILLKEISSLYLKVRMHYLNKTQSANCGKRQKKIHEIHFLGM